MNDEVDICLNALVTVASGTGSLLPSMEANPPAVCASPPGMVLITSLVVGAVENNLDAPDDLRVFSGC